MRLWRTRDARSRQRSDVSSDARPKTHDSLHFPSASHPFDKL